MKDKFLCIDFQINELFLKKVSKYKTMAKESTVSRENQKNIDTKIRRMLNGLEK